MTELNHPSTSEPPLKNVFIVRVAKEGRSNAITHNVIGIGWDDVPMDKIASEKWNASQIKDALKNGRPHQSPQKLGSSTGSIQRFCQKMKIGDYVLIPLSRAFCVGIVKSEVRRSSRPEADKQYMTWEREVEWVNKAKAPINRSTASRQLQNRLKARQTCLEIDDLIEDVHSALASGTASLLDEESTEEIKKIIAEQISSRIGNKSLETLIKQLCEKTGAESCKVLPTNDPMAGDADVQADYPIMVGNRTRYVRVLYQAKNHTGTTGEKGVEQLIARIQGLTEQEQGDKDVFAYVGCLVTTAKEVSAEALQKADENDIDVIALDELTDWILDVGLNNLTLNP